MKNPTRVVTSANQWAPLELPDEIPDESNICITGLRINIFNFKPIISQGKELLQITEPCIENYCLIAFRSYKEENHPEWRVNKNYYKNAIKIMKEQVPDVVFIGFTEDFEYANDIINEVEINLHHLYVGNRNGNTEVEHFYKMFQCNHAILIESSYHLMPSILNTNINHIVCIPSNEIWLHLLNIQEIAGKLIRVEF